MTDSEVNNKAKTPLNLTNHTYWNLSGDFGIEDIISHKLELKCDKIVAQDDDLVPTGDIVSVDDTPFDFRGGEKGPLLISANNRLEGACGGNGID